MFVHDIRLKHSLCLSHTNTCYSLQGNIVRNHLSNYAKLYSLPLFRNVLNPNAFNEVLLFFKIFQNIEIIVVSHVGYS